MKTLLLLLLLLLVFSSVEKIVRFFLVKIETLKPRDGGIEKMNTIKSVKTENGKRRLTSGDDYKPVEIKNPGQAMQACLHLFMSHSVDFFELMLTIVADKYEIPKEEMVGAVMADPRMKNMSVNPIIHSLGYFDDTDLQKSFAKMSVSKGEGAATVPAAEHSQETSTEETKPEETKPKPKVVRVIKVKKPV